MKKATFGEGVNIALISSVAVAAVFTFISSFFFGTDQVMLLIAMISFFYIIYLFMRTKEKVGRVTVMLIWFAITLSTLLFVTSILLFMAIQIFLIWLFRSLYFYNSILSSLTDLFLTGMSLIVAFWVWSHSESIFLTVWCFFLVQALFVFIPDSFSKNKKSGLYDYQQQDKFEYAHRAAEVAISKLVNNQ